MPLKPTGPVAARNPWGPRSDRLIALYAFDEGSGSALNNLAPGRTRFGVVDGTIVKASDLSTLAAGWTTNADGACLDLANSGTPICVQLMPAGTGNKTLPRGELLLRFTNPTAVDANPRFFLTSTASNTSQAGALAVLRVASQNTLRVKIEAGASDYTYEFAISAPDETTFYTLQIVWGECGFQAWLNGATGTPSNSPSSYTGGIVTKSAEHWWVGRGNTANQHALNKTGWLAIWDRPLAQVERDELLVDPYLNGRGKIANKWRTCIPVCGRATASGATFRLVATNGLSGTAYFRMKLAKSLAGVDSATPGSAGSTAVANASVDIAVTGLDGDSTYYWQAEESADGSTYRPMAGGIGLLRTVGATAPSIIIISDDHLNAEHDGGTVSSSLGHGIDIAVSDAGGDASGPRKAFYAWRAAHTAYTRETPAIVLWGGDNAYFDANTTVSVADVVTGMLDLAQTFIDRWWLAMKMGANYFMLGNHEGVAGYHLFDLARTKARRKQATIAFKRFFPNPDNTTYAEGGETGSYADQVPASTGDVPATRANSTAYTVGQKVKTSSDNYYAYECTTAGTSAGSQPTMSTTIGGTTADGTVVWTTRTRWDSAVEAAFETATENASPYCNYYAFTWGPLLLCVLDVNRYTAPGDEHGSHRESLQEYALGATQKNWLRGVLAGSSAACKVVCIHHMPGGELINYTGSDAYGRGSGVRIGDASYYSDIGTAENADELWLFNLCRRYGANIVKGHDHRFAHVVKQGVPIITLPTPGAANSYDESISIPSGWNYTDMDNSYGTAQSLGALNATGGDQTALGMVKHYNVLGYVRMETHTTNGVKYTLVRTSLPSRGSSFDKYRTWYFNSDRFVANQNEAKDGSNNIDAADALNATPTPEMVGMIVDVSSITGAWYEGSLTNRYNPTGDSWSPGVAYAVGDVVFPTTPNGFMAYCDLEGTSHVSDEPVWPTTEGEAIEDGTTEWVMYRVGQPPIGLDEYRVSGTLPATAAVASSVQTAVVPLDVYTTGWIAQAEVPRRAKVLLRIGMSLMPV